MPNQNLTVRIPKVEWHRSAVAVTEIFGEEKVADIGDLQFSTDGWISIAGKAYRQFDTIVNRRIKWGHSSARQTEPDVVSIFP